MDVVKWFPEKAKKALTNTGSDVINEIGKDVIVDIVHDVLIGENLRNSTELLTRKRLLTLNASLLCMFVKGAAQDENFLIKLHESARTRLLQGGVKKDEKWILEWILGLTDKAFQNVLRDDAADLERYQTEYSNIIDLAAREFVTEYGTLSARVKINDTIADFDWKTISSLMTAIGSQTLAIRGSDKSTFGKLFEKLVLASLLTVLGFKKTTPGDIGDGNMVFWLSERKDKRESDATLLFTKGKGVRFDIGFIGRGNPEISLDKVTRFERFEEINGERRYMATIIIVDRIGAGSRIEGMAEDVDGHIVQMSGTYWPKKVAEILNDINGYEDDILHVNGMELQNLIRSRLEKVNFAELLGDSDNL